MKVEYEQSEKMRPLGDLVYGDTFEHRGEILILLDEGDGGEEGVPVSLCATVGGVIYRYRDDMLVTPVNAKVVVIR